MYRPWLGGLPHLEMFTCQNAIPADRVTLPTWLPRLLCKHGQIKIRHYMERGPIISPNWGPPPPCKQALSVI